MKKIFVILLLIPILGFNQYNTKYYTKKQEINGFQQYADSITRILNAEIERLLENKETHQIEIDKLYQQQSKIQLASKYLKKSKKKKSNWNYSFWSYCFNSCYWFSSSKCTFKKWWFST